MEITKNIYIKNNRLYINASLEGSIVSSNEQYGFQSVMIYTSKSYIDGSPVYQHVWDENIYQHSYQAILTESDLNVMNKVLNGACYSVDISKELFIIVFSMKYNTEYVASHTCQDTPSTYTFAVYDKCNLYNGLLPSINELEDNCNVLPMNFVNGILKKKAIDACIEAGYYEQASKYWCKFYLHGAATFNSASSNSGGCGCHG